MKNKVVSAGIILTDGESFLIGHVTRASFWSIPKGKINQDESAIDAAIREFWEEANIHIDKNILKYLGKYNYTKEKDLELFYCIVDFNDYSECVLKCNSFVNNDPTYPEIDKYKIIKFTEMDKYLNYNQSRLINEIKSKIFNDKDKK